MRKESTRHLDPNGEREVCVMSSTALRSQSEEEITGFPNSEPRKRMPSYQELARSLMSENLTCQETQIAHPVRRGPFG
jgi:hypothetical protein